MTSDETIEKTETGFRLKIDSKRGTDTRDQDEVIGEAKAKTLEDLQEEREDLRATVQEEMQEARQHQPDDSIIFADDLSVVLESIDAYLEQDADDRQPPDAFIAALGDDIQELIE